MLSNYTDVQNQLRAVGLRGRRVDQLEITGRVVRTEVDGDREKRGWYLLRSLATHDGGELIVGSFGVWRGTENGAQKVDLGQSSDITAEQREAMRAKWREDRRRADAARKADAARAARRAELVWRKCAEQQPEGGVGYLTKKGIGAHGIRFSPDSAMVIPMHDAQGRIHGLQFILDRSKHKERVQKTGRDKEYWPKGLQKVGKWFQIGAVAGVCLLCEGYATGASLHEATQLPVAVAFDAGNLLAVARELRKAYPHAKILVCADDDFATKDNPGLSAASAAALAVDGAWVMPEYHVDDQIALRAQIAAEVDFTSADQGRDAVRAIVKSTGRKLTDFNDLHQAEGLLTVRTQIEQRLAALGWRWGQPARDTTTGGEGRAVDDWRFSIDVLLREYSLIYGTDTVFDHRRRMILGLGPLRSAGGKGLVRQWLEHPDRATYVM